MAPPEFVEELGDLVETIVLVGGAEVFLELVEAREEVDLLLRRCERGRYAGESIDTREVTARLARLDAMDWKDRGGQ